MISPNVIFLSADSSVIIIVAQMDEWVDGWCFVYRFAMNGHDTCIYESESQVFEVRFVVF